MLRFMIVDGTFFYAKSISSLTAGTGIPDALAHRRPQYLLDVVGPGRQHHQAVEAECCPGTLRQAVLEGGEEIFVDRVGLAVERVLSRLVAGEPRALLGGIGQLAEGVGELEPADIDLEALGETGIVGAAARQCGHRERVVVEDGRRPEAEYGLDPLEENAEEECLPIVARMGRYPDMARRGGEAFDIGCEGVGCRREEIDVAELRKRCGNAQPPPRKPRVG